MMPSLDVADGAMTVMIVTVVGCIPSVIVADLPIALQHVLIAPDVHKCFSRWQPGEQGCTAFTQPCLQCCASRFVRYEHKGAPSLHMHWPQSHVSGSEPLNAFEPGSFS
jgi:hypothetical protein